MKVLKIGCVILCAIFTFLWSCSEKKPPKPEPVKYKWSILGYFNGNNPEDQAPDGHSYVIQDLQEMEQIDSTEEVQVVVMLGSTETDGNCKYYHVEPNGAEVLLDLGKRDMSDPATLRDFINYGVQKYPAEHYMLIINDQGGGWRGICSDKVNGDGDWMSLPELSAALSGFKFDIILFYAPLMASAEVAYQVKDFSDYMIASQFKWYPDNIMGSARWLPVLTENPSIRTLIFAHAITDSLFKTAQSISPVKKVHWVLISLPKISEVADDVSNLGRYLIDSTGSFWNEVWDAWEVSHNYDDTDSNSAHLRKFALEIQKQPNLNSIITNAAEDLASSIEDAVLAENMYPYYHDLDSLGSLSVYFPWNHDDFDSVDYAQLDFPVTNWDGFISVFIQSFSDNYAGTLSITSEPTGARVFLDGLDTGYDTDALIGGIFPGVFYTLKLVKLGYQDWVKYNVFFDPQETKVLHAKLIPSH
jgi:hypothetical protein